MPDLASMLEELSRPAKSLGEMPRRVGLCRRALALVDREEDSGPWGDLHVELANSLTQNPQGPRADNLEQAIGHYQQALEVFDLQANPEGWALAQQKLALVYTERTRGDQADNLEQAIVHFEQALEVYTRQAYSQEWAITQQKLAMVYAKRVRGERAENLEQAIARYEQTLEVFVREADPRGWALAQYNLADAYFERLFGERAENLEQAIAHFEQALEVFTRQADLPLWAAVQVALALVYTDRTRGERADNLEQAIVHFEQALEVYTRQAYPQEWAETQIELAFAYTERTRGDQADNLEQAIVHFEQALEVFDLQANPEGWALAQQKLALVYTERTRGDQADTLEQAIVHFEQALEVYTRQAYSQEWAITQQNLAMVYAKRVRGERADNLEQAIAHFEQALEVFTWQAYPSQWAATQAALALVYTDRTRGDQATNVEEVITRLKQALEVVTRQAYPSQWAANHSGLAMAYRARIRGERAENLEQAIAHFEQALEVYTREADPRGWALTQYNLAGAYFDRLFGEPAENLEQAIAHFEQALEVFTRQADLPLWAAVQVGLALVYTDRTRGERADNLEQAIVHFEQALEVVTRQAYPQDWAETQNGLAMVYAKRVRGERAENLEQAIAHFEQALEVRTLAQFATGFQNTQRELGNVHFGEGEWAAALGAYQEALRAEQVLLTSAFTEAGRRAEVSQTVGLYAGTTYALLKLNRAREALLRLEQGKTRLLSHALALNEVDLSGLPTAQQETFHGLRQTIRELEAEMRLPPDTPARRDDRTLADALEQARNRLNDTIEEVRRSHPEFMPEGLALTELLALIPEGAALVAPVLTSQGSAVFVVPSGRQSVGLDEVVWVDDFKDADLYTLLVGPNEAPEMDCWLATYFNARHDVQAWRDAIDEMGRVLWKRLIGPVHERLTSLGIQHILLMPQGGLGLLPLHAAWREIDGRRCYLLDDYTVTYVPSTYALHVSQERLSDMQRQARTLFAVVNPTEDLPFTKPEGEQLAKLFGEAHAVVLSGDKATSHAVKKARAGYLHFACHGFYHWLDPMRSGLRLANGELLTLAEIIGQFDLFATRLVTLSACETGIMDVFVPDEYVGLPAGFLQAGAPAVVSTLWAVNDLSTMLLMECFYQLHLKQGLRIAEALRQAQRWLRVVTAGELAKRFVEEEEALLNQTRMSIEAASEYVDRFADQDPEARPFAHPYYWAAFTLSGA